MTAVRAAAVAALQAVVEATGGGAALPPSERSEVQGRLTAMGASERSVAVAAQVRPHALPCCTARCLAESYSCWTSSEPL